MAETGDDTSVVKEKDQKKKIIVIIIAALVCFIVIFTAVRVFTSPARRLQRQIDLGNRYLEEMDYEQAIVAFDKVIEIDPKNVDAYLGKADAYIRLGDSAMAIETLETGYQATDGSKTIKDNLLDIYFEMAKNITETGSYEEGMKAYERIVELEGEEEELWKKTEELQDGESEEKYIAQEKGEVPYYELGFSPEDFTIAGYSIMDGNHLDDVEQAAAAVMPNVNDNEVLMGDYVGWNYNRTDYSEGSGRIGLDYYVGQLSRLSYDTNAVSYEVSDTSIVLSVDAPGVEMGVTVDEFPLYKGSVIPNMTSYEETLDILGIGQLIQDMEKTESVWFESQYGAGEFWKQGYGIADNAEYAYYIFLEEADWSLSIFFYDNVLCGIELRNGCKIL